MFKAVIFDFDGVIADTEWLHSETFRKVLAEEGIFITDEDHDARFLGINDRAAFVKAFAEVNREVSPAGVESLVERKSVYYTEKLGDVQPYPGVIELIRGLAGKGPLAIASGGRRAEIDAILRAHRLLDYFLAVYSSDQVTRSKPAPDLFLAAYGALRDATRDSNDGLLTSQCVAIEDSIQGIRAAKAARLHCIAVAHTYSADRLGEADRVVERIADLKVDDLLRG